MQSAPDDDGEKAGNVCRASLPPSPCVKLEAREEQAKPFTVILACSALNVQV